MGTEDLGKTDSRMTRAGAMGMGWCLMADILVKRGREVVVQSGGRGVEAGIGAIGTTRGIGIGGGKEMPIGIEIDTGIEILIETEKGKDTAMIGIEIGGGTIR